MCTDQANAQGQRGSSAHSLSPIIMVHVSVRLLSHVDPKVLAAQQSCGQLLRCRSDSRRRGGSHHSSVGFYQAGSAWWLAANVSPVFLTQSRTSRYQRCLQLQFLSWSLTSQTQLLTWRETEVYSMQRKLYYKMQQTYGLKKLQEQI